MIDNEDIVDSAPGQVAPGGGDCIIRRFIYHAVINMYNRGLSALSLGLIPSLCFVDVWGEDLGFVE